MLQFAHVHMLLNVQNTSNDVYHLYRLEQSQDRFYPNGCFVYPDAQSPRPMKVTTRLEWCPISN